MSPYIYRGEKFSLSILLACSYFNVSIVAVGIVDARFQIRKNTYLRFSFFHTVVGDGAKVKQQKKGREIALPASCYYPFASLLEHAHDFVDDAKEYQVVIIVLFQRTKCFGMSVKGSKVTS